MTGIDSYSTTPATNATCDAGAINYSEGMPPSAVNNTARQALADTRSRHNDLIWFVYGTGDQGAGNIAVPAVYASSTSFTIAGADVTTVYTVGRKVRAVGSGTGTIYGIIKTTAYAPTTTTVTVTWDSGSLSNETLVISLCQIPATGKPVSPSCISTNVYRKMAADAPTGTTSATTVQMGLGSAWVLTARSTGRIRIYVTGWAAGSAAAYNIAINATYGTGAAPSNGAAKTGTYFSTADILSTPQTTGSPAVPFTLICEATGLTVGTAYWFDLTVTSNGVATSSVSSMAVIIEEIP